MLKVPGKRVRDAVRRDLRRTTPLRWGFRYLLKNPRLIIVWSLLSLVVYVALRLVKSATGWESFPDNVGMAIFVAGGIYISPKLHHAARAKEEDQV
jgi:uncharacterized membrane protein YeiH